MPSLFPENGSSLGQLLLSTMFLLASSVPRGTDSGNILKSGNKIRGSRDWVARGEGSGNPALKRTGRGTSPKRSQQWTGTEELLSPVWWGKLKDTQETLSTAGSCAGGGSHSDDEAGWERQPFLSDPWPLRAPTSSSAEHT